MNLKNSCAAALLSFAFTPFALAGVISGPITDPANGHQYYLLAQDSWTNSEAQAQALGGHLATINDAAENTFVFNTFGNDRDLWTGLNNAATFPNFVWSSGEPVTYTNWDGGEPNNNNGNERYVEIWGAIHDVSVSFGTRHYGAWNDFTDIASPQDTTVSQPYGVVEVAPEPASLGILGIGGIMLMRRRRR